MESYFERVVERLTGAGYRWYETANFCRRRPRTGATCARGTTSPTGAAATTSASGSARSRRSTGGGGGRRRGSRRYLAALAGGRAAAARGRGAAGAGAALGARAARPAPRRAARRSTGSRGAVDRGALERLERLGPGRARRERHARADRARPLPRRRRHGRAARLKSLQRMIGDDGRDRAHRAPAARILRGVVEEYVATGQPVGSKTLVERAGLDVSPSTVRSELAELERLGPAHAPAHLGRARADRARLPLLRRPPARAARAAARRRSRST